MVHTFKNMGMGHFPFFFSSIKCIWLYKFTTSILGRFLRSQFMIRVYHCSVKKGDFTIFFILFFFFFIFFVCFFIILVLEKIPFMIQKYNDALLNGYTIIYLEKCFFFCTTIYRDQIFFD